MTTERDHKTHELEFICDFCGERHLDEGVYSSEDFSFAWNELKRMGWRTFKEGEDWIHKCPKCINRRDR